MPLLTVDEVIERIDAVTLDDLRELAGELFAPERLSAAGIGADEAVFRERARARRAGRWRRRPDDPRRRRGRRRPHGRRRSARPSRAPTTWSSPAAPTRRWGPRWQDVLGDVDVVVDFTRPDTALENALACVAAGRARRDRDHGLRRRAAREIGADPRANVFIAPNFAIGAVLMMRFAAEASRHMAKAEIVELHHDRKLDAPSGTAARTAELMEGDVPIHSVRLPGLVAHQEVILGDVGPDADDPPRLDRPRVVHARRAAGRAQGGTLSESPVVGLEHLL